MEHIKSNLNAIKSLGLYPDVKIIDSSPTPEVVINGKKVLLFCSSNYLGLATNEDLINHAISSIRRYGLGSGGSRLLSGSYTAHRDLETTLSQFKGTDDSITFNSGFQTNFSVISALVKPVKFGFKDVLFPKRTVIFSDELNHASIVDGCRFGEGEIVVYKHNDMTDLEEKLEKNKRNNKIIVTDGVFSMDGDIARLDKITDLARTYNSLVYVDDAHATGVLGKKGSGTAEHYNVKDKVDIQMGTFSKAVGVLGGYVAASKDIIEYLRVTARSYIFSTAMPPAIASVIEESIKIIENRNDLRQKLFENAKYLREGLHKIGFDTLTSETQIIPILIGNDNKSIECSKYLFERGILGPNVRWPAVAKNQSRIRFTVMATHTRTQLDYLLTVCSDMKKDLL
jgi:8-amino-7-oxononanoate synthase